MPQGIKPLHLTIALGNYLSVCSSECELEDICVQLLRLALPKKGQGVNLPALTGTGVRNVRNRWKFTAFF